MPPPPANLASYLAPDGAPWRCERLDLLQAELAGCTADDLPALHAALEPHDRLWLVARRLWGLMSRIPSAGEPAAERRVWSAAEVCAASAYTAKDLRACLDGLAGLAGPVIAARRGQAEAQAAALPARREAFKPELDLEKAEREDHAFLDEHDLGFVQFTDERQRRWFANRLRSMKKLFQVPGTRETARSLALAELELRDAQQARSELPKTSDDDHKKGAIAAAASRLAKAQANVTELTEKLHETAEWFFGVEGVTMGYSLAKVIEAHERYGASGDTVMFAGLWTATDIQVLHRLSEQSAGMPGLEIGFRPGLNAHLTDARAGIFNPKWRSRYPVSLLGKMDNAYRAAFVAAHKESGDPLPDLLKDGPAGEYPPLVVPEEPKQEEAKA
jgi:hypothetical protein